MTTAEGSEAGISLGVIVPDLSAAGGAERLALRCVARWQRRHRVTLYSVAFDAGLVAAAGVDVPCRTLSRGFFPQHHPGPVGPLFDAIVAPRIWSTQVERHDVYLGHQWRTLCFERRPFVWYAHESFRHASDLRRHRDDEHVRRDMELLLDGPDPVAPHLRHEIFGQAMRAIEASASPDRVVANSRRTAADLERSLGRPCDRVVYPGVDAEAFAEPRFDEPFFLSVGGLLPHKRQRLAVEALALVPDARLVIVGRGRCGPELERMAARLGVSDRVEIRSDVGDEALRDLYARCRGVVFTPLNEPFGMVALEALAAGKPLVAVEGGGYAEIVDGACALLVPPEPPAIAAALRDLLDRPDEARRMGAAGRKIARAWSWDRTAEALEAVLLDAHREARAPATSRPPARPAARPEVGVRLVLDYGEGAAAGAWRRPGATDEMPRDGHYASHHESTLRRQLAEIETCGFDFTLLSLRLDDRHLSPRGAAALDHALALAPELGRAARFAVELVLDAPTATRLADALDWIARRLRDSDAVFSLGDRPLVLLRGSPDAAAPTHPELDLRVAPEPVSPGAPEPAEPEALRVVSLAGDADLAASLHAARAAPGAAAVIVASWNDYAAGEHLEPTVRGGTARLEAARVALERR